MPSLFRFLSVVGTIAAIIFGGLFAMGHLYEPDQQDVIKAVPGVKVRKQ